MSRRIDLVFPRFKLLSGAERLILELAGAFARQGHKPRVVCHRFDDSCRPLLYHGVELAESGAKLDWFASRYVNAVFDYARVGALHRLLDPSAVGRVLFGPAIRLARGGQSSIPQVYHCFEPPRVLYQDRAEVLARAGAARWPLSVALAVYARIDRRLVHRLPAITTAPGSYPARHFETIYGRPAVPIAHGLSRESLDRHTSVQRDPARLITVNYLHPRKRVDLAIAAFARVPGVTPGGHPVTLEIVGDGPERAKLESQTEALGVAARVRFSGFVDEAQLAAHYRGAGCYVHAGRAETFGLSVIEAAYCGLPVVAVAEGGVVDNVVDGETGLLTTADRQALADAIQTVLSRDDGGRAMGERGRAHVDERCSWDRGAADLLRVMDNVPISNISP